VGFALQSFAPPAQPHTVSGAVALLSLKDLRPTAFKKLISVALPKRGAKCQLPSGGLVQASSPSGLYSTRESATSLRLFTPPGARSSPGIHPLQGLLPHQQGATLHRASPHEVASTADESTTSTLLQGFASR
jgi:hypothetical protein